MTQTSNGEHSVVSALNLPPLTVKNHSMKKTVNLYYSDRDFYRVKQTDKTITIDWAEHLQTDGTPLDQGIKWKHLVAKKTQTHPGGHPVKQNDENGILLYPFQSGIPFFLEPATFEHITNEIGDCKKWGVSDEYYQNLLKLL